MEDATKIAALDTTQIVPGDNDRKAFDTVELQKLADSLQAHGLAQPITIRPICDGIYQIVAGERRLRASQLLGWPTIPAIVREMDDEVAAGAEPDDLSELAGRGASALVARTMSRPSARVATRHASAAIILYIQALHGSSQSATNAVGRTLQQYYAPR